MKKFTLVLIALAAVFCIAREAEAARARFRQKTVTRGRASRGFGVASVRGVGFGGVGVNVALGGFNSGFNNAAFLRQRSFIGNNLGFGYGSNSVFHNSFVGSAAYVHPAFFRSAAYVQAAYVPQIVVQPAFVAAVAADCAPVDAGPVGVQQPAFLPALAPYAAGGCGNGVSAGIGANFGGYGAGFSRMRFRGAFGGY